MADPMGEIEELVAQLRRDLADARSERDDAMIRLGSLGLSPNLDADAQEVVAALGSMLSHRGDGIPTQVRNPDGKAAVALIESTIAERDQLRRLLADALADLEKSDRRSSKVAGLLRAELAKAPDAV